jgi:hypothetical protein
VPAVQERGQIVAGRRQGGRLESSFLEQPERPVHGPALAGPDQDAHRSLDLARQHGEVEAHVLRRERHVALELEGHHRRELAPARARKLEDLDREQRARETDPHAAEPEPAALQLGLEAGPGHLARLHSEALDAAATPGGHHDR